MGLAGALREGAVCRASLGEGSSRLACHGALLVLFHRRAFLSVGGGFSSLNITLKFFWRSHSYQ